MSQWGAIKPRAVFTPLGQVLIHQGQEAVVVVALAQMHQFMHQNELQTLWWLFSQFQIYPDPAGAGIATTPLRFHLLDAPGGGGDADSGLPIADNPLNALPQSHAIPLAQDKGAGIQVGTDNAMKYADAFNVPRAIFLNKLDRENIDYDALIEMDDVNPTFGQTDVTIVIGANDVVNPVARSDPDSPIAGMPILDVDKSRVVVVIKRSLSPGFAGIPNPLFAADNTLMMFGDGKEAVVEITKALADL